MSSGPSIALTVFEGMDGIGKTVLAQALSRDEAVQNAFPGGVTLDGNRAVSASWDEALNLWDLDAGGAGGAGRAMPLLLPRN